MDGRDLHIGDWEWGILPATAPLSISTLSIAGIAMAFSREGQGRVALSFIGEGGSSLGEWHEAINLCAARRLPAVFCIENNQTALSTSVSEQSAARVFADKADGYGIPGITIDGTDPDQVAAAFTWAADRARSGAGPALIELVSMRMSGHAHHDDMLFLGKEPPITWEYPRLSPAAYADPELYAFWAARDPIAVYAKRLESAGVIGPLRRGSLQEGGARDSSRRRRARSLTRRGRAARGGHARLRWWLDTGARRSTRAGDSPCDRSESATAAGRPTGCRSIGRARHFSMRLRSASRTRCAPIRASSSTVRTWAANTATRSCCCGLSSRSSAIASSTRHSQRAVCSVCASAPRWPASGRSVRCSSTTSSPAASTSS